MVSIRRIQASVTAEEFEEIERVKDDLGLTWDEFVVEAAKCLREREE